MSMFICGLDDTRAERDACPNPIHDHPLAASPMVARYEADERLDTGWTQARCPDCKCFGWIAPDEEGKETNGTD